MDNAHNIARGLIRNLDYDILICGSSMCENMHTEYVDAIFPGSKSIKGFLVSQFDTELISEIRLQKLKNYSNGWRHMNGKL